LLEDQPNKIVIRGKNLLRHLLTIGDKIGYKKNTDLYTFIKGKTWNIEKLSTEEVKRQ